MAYPTPSVREMEQAIVRSCIKSAIAAGYKISLDNGGDDFEFEDLTDEERIYKEMFATDDETLMLRKDGKQRFIRFVFGNDGWDVVCDYTSRLEEEIMAEPNKISEAYQRVLGHTDQYDAESLVAAKQIVLCAQEAVGNNVRKIIDAVPEPVLGDELANKVKLLLQYSFHDTEGVYEDLTNTERSIISKEEFEELKKWAGTGKVTA